MDDIWIPLGESLLISRFVPLWNKWVDGFGNHDPGGGRYNQERSRWDVLHPGRPWATKCKERKEALAQIETDVAARLRDMYD
ncbi:Eco29kI family restriction endonuclease [Roseospirillum parvum]|uniref:Eco29kI family restriction endonuclease n=1 Tax=Roseospirillum parvum TaxID=83401 RepID=UPI001C40B22A